jgi:PAS domain S-box-containing protein
MKALVVSSNDEKRRSLKALIARSGWSVDLAEQENAISRYKSEMHSAVIVCAVGVSDWGIDFATQFRAIPNSWRASLFSVCESFPENIADKLLASGFDDVLELPFQEERLAHRLISAEQRSIRIGQTVLRDEPVRSLIKSPVSLARDVPYGVFRSVAEGYFLQVNRALVEMLGYDNEREVLDLSINNDINAHPEDTEKLWNDWANYVDGQDIRIKRRDGTTFVGRIFGRLIRDENGCACELEGIMQDVTESVHAEQRIRQTNEELLAIYEGMPDGILVVDIDTEAVLRTNPAMSRITGYSRDDLLKSRIEDIVFNDPTIKITSMHKSVMEGQWNRFSGLKIRHRKGVEVYCDLVVSALIYGSRQCLVAFFSDATEQIKAQQATAKTAARFRSIFDQAALGMAVTDRNGVILEVNNVLTDLVEFSSPVELVGRNYTEFFNPEDASEIQEEVERCFVEGQTSFQVVRPLLVESGRKVWARVSLSFMEDAKVIHVVEDVTERKEALEDLAESEASLRRVLTNMPDILVVLNLKAEVVYINRDSPDLTIDEIVGKIPDEFICDRDISLFYVAFKEIMSTRATQTIAMEDRFGLWWQCRCLPVEKNGEIQNVMVFLTDITKERKSEEAIREEQEHLRKLLALFERDRGLISFELHDGFCQQLTGAILNFDAASSRFEPEGSNTPKADECYRRGMELLKESIAESRRLVRGLRPPVLDEFGIVPAIEHLASDFSQDGCLKVDLIANLDVDRLAHPIESAVFRIVQESLNNVQQHSQSDRVEIRLFTEENMLRVQVEDWGIGFDPDKVAAQHFGLHGIRERARLLGGLANIDSQPGCGARVLIELPLIESPPPNETIQLQ